MKKKPFILILFLMMFMLLPMPTYAKSNPKTVVFVKLRKTPKVRSIYYKKGKKIQINVSYMSLLAKKDAVFTSSNKSVATVSKNGIIKTKKAGKTKITITSPSTKKRAILKLNVRKSSTIFDIASKYGSKTRYFIIVNKSTHTVYALRRDYNEWHLIKSFPCCVGAASTPTPSGVFELGDKGGHFYTEGGNMCWYYSHVTRTVLFHSQIYAPASYPETIVDGSMGVSCSHGCIRLYLKDARWINKKMPRRSTVYIF